MYLSHHQSSTNRGHWKASCINAPDGKREPTPPTATKLAIASLACMLLRQDNAIPNGIRNRFEYCPMAGKFYFAVQSTKQIPAEQDKKSDDQSGRCQPHRVQQLSVRTYSQQKCKVSENKKIVISMENGIKKSKAKRKSTQNLASRF